MVKDNEKWNNIRIRREDDDKLNMLKNLKGISKTELISELLQNVDEEILEREINSLRSNKEFDWEKYSVAVSGKEAWKPSEKVINQVLDKDPLLNMIKTKILNPSYKKRESSKPPTAVLDACILNQLKSNGSKPLIKTREELKSGVVDFLSNGWIQLFKAFARNAEERHSQFERYFDNRLRMLSDDGLLQSPEPSSYQLQNKLTSDNWKLIDAMLIILPHKDIKLTKLRFS